jgi:hypothetical protein
VVGSLKKCSIRSPQEQPRRECVVIEHLGPVRKRPRPGRLAAMCGKTPIFFWGSASQNKYLRVTIKDNQKTVAKVNSADSGFQRTTEGTYTRTTRKR